MNLNNIFNRHNIIILFILKIEKNEEKHKKIIPKILKFRFNL